MSGARKRILSPFTGRKNGKAWNKTREKYMPVKRRQNLAETGRGWLEEFLNSKVAFYNGYESDNDDESYNENNEQKQLLEGFANSCYKTVLPILLQKQKFYKFYRRFCCKHQKHWSGIPLPVEVASHDFGS